MSTGTNFHDVYTLDDWDWAQRKYYGKAAPVENMLPRLMEDPAIAHAVLTVQNAERAIEARVQELLG